MNLQCNYLFEEFRIIHLWIYDEFAIGLPINNTTPEQNKPRAIEQSLLKLLKIVASSSLYANPEE